MSSTQWQGTKAKASMFTDLWVSLGDPQHPCVPSRFVKALRFIVRTENFTYRKLWLMNFTLVLRKYQ